METLLLLIDIYIIGASLTFPIAIYAARTDWVIGPAEVFMIVLFWPLAVIFGLLQVIINL